ncbi:hypothetical protein DRI50_05995 [candidate division KSB1 bacterium]|nr:MAG: hypothetical protein DRI50_05995 [candidate division KSB1 bacterium]
MLDIIKKSIYLGLGAASLTKERVDKLVDELIEKGQVAKDDKANAVKDIMDKVEKEEKELEKRIKKTVNEAIESVGAATQNDIDELKKQLKELEEKLAEMKAG